MGESELVSDYSEMDNNQIRIRISTILEKNLEKFNHFF